MRPTLHEYVIEQASNCSDWVTKFARVQKFTKLTNRALRLGDFVPTDEDDNVLEEPKYWKEHLSGLIAMADTGIHLEKCKQYQTAKDKVIFAGDWEVVTSNEFITRIHSKTTNITIDFDSIRIGLVRTDKSGFVIEKSYPCRIEDLPRGIEFKNGVI